MKLSEFVTETLCQIIEGVKESQLRMRGSGGVVNPGKRVVRSANKTAATVGQVAFDVAVTTSEGTQKQAGAGVFVAGLGMGAKGKADESHTSISRVQFSVRIQLPKGTRTD